MASKSKFRHEEIAAVPAGYKVRTVTQESGHKVRLAFPPGRKKAGTGQLVSILHPLSGENPCPNPCTANPGILEEIKQKIIEATDWALTKIRKQKAAVSNPIVSVIQSQALGRKLTRVTFPDGKEIEIPRVFASKKKAIAAAEKLSKMPWNNPASKRVVLKTKLEDIVPETREKLKSKPKTWVTVSDNYKMRWTPKTNIVEWAHNPAKKNLDEIQDAAALAAAFKGSPAENIRGIDLSNKQRDDYAHLGWMEQIVFHPPYDADPIDLVGLSEDYRMFYDESGDSQKAWKEAAAEQGAVLLIFDVDGDEIELASSADGQQLYFLGGNQGSFASFLDEFGTEQQHDKVDLGEIVSVTYIAQKKQAGDTEPRGYYHVFGEEEGTAPRGYFDMLNKRIFIFGGSYHIKDPKLGIIN